MKLNDLKFYYKYQNNLLPYYLLSSHATRSENKIVKWRPMHDYAKMFIRYNIPNTINKIYTHSIQGFSGYIKQGLLQSYHE